MTGIPGVVLPSPSTVSRRPISFVQRSIGSVVINSRLTSPRRPSVFDVTWSNRSDAARHAVLEHYFGNWREPFEWTPPGESTAVEVMYVGAPQASRANGRWTINAQLEQTL